MGASTSQIPESLDNEQPLSGARLIAPRPSLLPVSPKRPMKRDASCGSLLLGLRPTLKSSAISSIRKCETVIALSSMEPLRPVNRLRMGSSKGLMCSRCSSVLSMQASRASLNTVLEVAGQSPSLLCKLCLSERDASCGSLLLGLRPTLKSSAISNIRKCETVIALSSMEPLRPVNRLRMGSSKGLMCSRCSSVLSMQASRASLNTVLEVAGQSPSLLCKLCLSECLRQYVTLEVTEAAYEISCPDAQCDRQEVDRDSGRVWCPRAGCETVCRVCPGCLPQAVHCPTCEDNFCSNCKQPWHPGKTCPEDKGSSKLVFDPECIKRCPNCSVPIEKDEGCAQMMCKRCKHDDFLLRHYDKGPCKNKLGHSRASVIWHRTQVIAIFAGFGVLLLVASPLLLLAAPCIVCCKCRTCQDKPADTEGSVSDLESPNPS
ncbi:UNVERIFIED_CONTAM: hypothetical protein B566_EDAN017466 [Ephemera danica]|nr:hypothetical protein B566_EDAN017466 [Ephemera danica]